MEQPVDGPRTMPPDNDVKIAKHPWTCHTCHGKEPGGTVHAWMTKIDKLPGDRDWMVHPTKDCWHDTEWEHQFSRQPHLNRYDKPDLSVVEDEQIDPLMFTKQKLKDKPVAEQPSNRELVQQIGAAIEALQEIRRELHEVYKKLHHPYYGQD